jgi:hypothetical protein
MKRVLMMLNIIFFMLISLPINCKEIDWYIERDMCVSEYMEDDMFQMVMFELEMYPACDIFDDGDNYPWILDEAYDDYEWIEEENE